MAPKLVLLTQEGKKWLQFSNKAIDSRFIHHETKIQQHGLLKQSKAIIFA